MKTLYKICLVGVFLSFFFGSCYDDKGNYDYHEINHIVVKHAYFDTTSISLKSFADTLRISPEVTGTLISDPDNYEYEWVAVRSLFDGVGETVYELGNEKDLEFPITLPSGTYKIYYKVFDKKSKLTGLYSVTLRLATSFSRGWVILGEGDDGLAQLDMVSISTDTTILKNILVNADLPLGKPVYLYVPPYRPTPALNYVMVSTDDGTYRISNLDMQPVDGSHLKWAFYDMSVVDDCVMTDAVQILGYVRAMIIDGKFFYVNLTGSSALNIDMAGNHYMGSDDLFAVGDKVGSGIKENSQTIVLYNKDAGRFVARTSPYIAYFSNLGDGLTDPFSWAPGPDYKFVTTINTRRSEGHTYTILENGGDYYLYIYRISSYYGVIKQTRVKLDNIVDLDRAEFFGASSYLSIFYYTVGNKLYGYDYSKKKCELLETYDNYEVTLLYHDILAQTTQDNFYVALYDPTQPASTGGIIKKYAVVDDVNDIIIKENPNSEWRGLCKVKSISYKAM